MFKLHPTKYDSNSQTAHFCIDPAATKTSAFVPILDMRTTDILWTKPSELSFYCGLGIPINGAAHWQPGTLQPELARGDPAGYPQGDPHYTDQWLFHLLEGGRLADAAWDGFLKERKYGTCKIREIIANGTIERESSVLRR